VAFIYRSLAPSCQLRAKVQHALGRREYILEQGTDDFYSMKDLEDISRGTFATFPDMLRTTGRKIRAHIGSGHCGPCHAAGLAICAAGPQCQGNSVGLITSSAGPLPSQCSAVLCGVPRQCAQQAHACCKCKAPWQAPGAEASEEQGALGRARRSPGKLSANGQGRSESSGSPQRKAGSEQQQSNGASWYSPCGGVVKMLLQCQAVRALICGLVKNESIHTNFS